MSALAASRSITMNTLADAIEIARVRCWSDADVGRVDEVLSAWTEAWASRSGVSPDLTGLVVSLGGISLQPLAELTREATGSKGDKYTLTRKHGAARWTICGCWSWKHPKPEQIGVDGVTTCRHTRAANGEPPIQKAAKRSATEHGAPLAKAPADPLARYARAYLPETIELFRPRLLRIERMNEDETVDHRAFARELRVLTNEIESWDRSLRASREIGAGR